MSNCNIESTHLHNVYLYIGAYVPVTMEGNIVIDGILASCYPSSNHDLAHFGMAPIRWFPEIIECIFGEDDGFQGFVKINKYLSQWLFPYQQ